MTKQGDWINRAIELARQFDQGPGATYEYDSEAMLQFLSELRKLSPPFVDGRLPEDWQRASYNSTEQR